MNVTLTGLKPQLPSNLKDLEINIGDNKPFPSKTSQEFKNLTKYIHDDLVSNPKYVLPTDTKVNLLLKSQIKDGAVFIASVDQYYDQNG